MVLSTPSIRLAAVSVASAGLCLADAHADTVLDWNDVFTEVLIANTDLQNPGTASRSMAMMNLAIYDAFAICQDTDAFYTHDGDTLALGDTAHRDAAAAQAAYTVLSSIYTDQQSLLDTALANSLAAIDDGAAKTAGIAMGAKVADAIVATRATDGYDTSVQFTPTGEVGHWDVDPLNPDQEAWGPAWGDVDTFAIASVDPHLPPDPPALDSQEHADAFNEVKELGSIDSTSRTADQTEAALYWAYDRVGMGTPMHLFNNVLQTVATDQGNTAEENAELFAMASVAMADAGIVAWNSKFEHDLWRPVTGIRDADLDGNPLTEAVADWTPLGAPDGEDLTGFTPPFPTYLSGHATFGGALFGTLIEWYGTDDIAFTLESEELLFLLDPDNADLLAAYGLDGLTDAERTFASFSEAMAENGRSRVYLGIHWNYDDTLGQIAGQSVASSLFTGAFVAVPEPAAALALAAVGLIATARRRIAC
ncbi:MAG: vanadium-dependent haloperoxidase [Planctomycetota bacterium]